MVCFPFQGTVERISVSVSLNGFGSSYSESPLPDPLCSLIEVEGGLNLLVVLVDPDWGALEPLAVKLVGLFLLVYSEVSIQLFFLC